MTQHEAINKLLEELQKKVKEIEEIYWALQTLKKYGADIELPEFTSLLKINGNKIPATDIAIRPDEFFGLSNTDATERYLKKVGHAMSLGEIYNALLQGGVQFTGEGRKSLYVQLVRATRKFVKIGKGQAVNFGLLEWYPKRKEKTIKPEDTSEEEESPFTEEIKKQEKADK